MVALIGFVTVVALVAFYAIYNGGRPRNDAPIFAPERPDCRAPLSSPDITRANRTELVTYNLTIWNSLVYDVNTRNEMAARR